MAHSQLCICQFILQAQQVSWLFNGRASHQTRPADDEEAKSDDYSSEMQTKMGGFLTYRHEDGMNFAHVLDNVIVGSCLQTPEDLDR